MARICWDCGGFDRATLVGFTGPCAPRGIIVGYRDPACKGFGRHQVPRSEGAQGDDRVPDKARMNGVEEG